MRLTCLIDLLLFFVTTAALELEIRRTRIWMAEECVLSLDRTLNIARHFGPFFAKVDLPGVITCIEETLSIVY
jgi:hypothetical protein